MRACDNDGALFVLNLLTKLHIDEISPVYFFNFLICLEIETYALVKP